MTDPTHTRRLAAILAADVEGYSRLMGDDEKATVQTLTDYRQVFAENILRHQGHVVDTAGDSVLATFESPVEAVECATEIQRELARRNRNLAEHRQMAFRIGINLDDIITREDGTVYGDGVNVAARLQSLAEAGGITVSGAVYDHVENKLPLSFEFTGEHSVKNVAKPVRAYRVGSETTSSSSRPVATRTTTRSSGKRWITVASVAALIVIVISAWHLLRTQQSGRLKGEPVVAVLAFTNLSGDPKQEYFSDGVSETIIDNLAQVRELKVIARNSSFRYKGKAVDIRTVGEELGAHYIVEGSVRRSADKVRVTAQLIDAKSDAHLWSKTYDRELTAQDIFAIQDDIAADVVTTISGMYGVLNKASLDAIRRESPSQLKSYDCVLLSLAYLQVLSLETFRATRDCAEEAVKTDPDYAPLWVVLATIWRAEYQFNYDPRPNALERSLEAGRRALQLDPQVARAHHQLALTYFFRRDIDSFKLEAERELELGIAGSQGTLGIFLIYAGEWEKGQSLIEQAKRLDPYPPSYYLNGEFHDAYRKKDYEKAVEVATRIFLPDWVQGQSQMIAALGQLERIDEAKQYIKRIYEIEPNFDARKHWQARFFHQPEYLEHLLDGMRKAGMKVSDS